MPKHRTFLALALAAGVGAAAPAQASAQAAAVDDPRAADVETLDGIIRAYYEVVSGPAGEAPDRARDEFLHLPDARVGLTLGSGAEARFRLMSLGEFHDRFGGPRAAPFYEWEIHRETHRFGNVAHVWSTYVISDAPGGEPRMRGINSIQLHHDGARWWIAGWIYDAERPGVSLPPAYLPPAEG